MHLHKYEKIWLYIGGGSLVIFLLLLGLTAFIKGTQPPSHMETIDPKNVQAHEAFKDENLGLKQIDDHQYEVHLVASAFNYDFGTDENGTSVKEIRIPVGSTVRFTATTTDVIHGFEVAGTNVNMMLEPGYISSLEVTLDNPGTYTVVCNEYCGLGHHMMYGKVEVFEE